MEKLISFGIMWKFNMALFEHKAETHTYNQDEVGLSDWLIWICRQLSYSSKLDLLQLLLSKWQQNDDVAQKLKRNNEFFMKMLDINENFEEICQKILLPNLTPIPIERFGYKDHL